MNNSNSLSVFTKENFSEKKVSTKELAEVLGVSTDTIQNTVKKLADVLRSVEKNSYGGYLFNEEQAIIIKKEIQKHHNLETRQIDSVTSELEENDLILQALAILKKRNETLKERAEKAEQKLEEESENIAFAHQITDCNQFMSIESAAKIMNIKGIGRNKLFEILREKGFFIPESNKPYQKYIDLGYFRQIEEKFSKNGQTCIYIKTLISNKGIKAVLKSIGA